MYCILSVVDLSHSQPHVGHTLQLLQAFNFSLSSAPQNFLVVYGQPTAENPHTIHAGAALGHIYLVEGCFSLCYLAVAQYRPHVLFS